VEALLDLAVTSAGADAFAAVSSEMRRSQAVAQNYLFEPVTQSVLCCYIASLIFSRLCKLKCGFFNFFKYQCYSTQRKPSHRSLAPQTFYWALSKISD